MRAFYLGNAGKFLWDNMKADIAAAFGYSPDCGGAQFLTLLDEMWRGGTKPTLTLVGHSAGSIYACQLLQEIEKRKLPADIRFNVIFIAPACTFDLLADTIKAASNRISALRVFGMDDQREREDALLPILYPSSLLYFVSGVLESESDTPLVGMARFYNGVYEATKFPSLGYARSAPLLQSKSALVWALASGGDGLNCDMRKHGEWPKAEATLKSVQYIVKNGYGDAAGS